MDRGPDCAPGPGQVHELSAADRRSGPGSAAVLREHKTVCAGGRRLWGTAGPRHSGPGQEEEEAWGSRERGLERDS